MTPLGVESLVIGNEQTSLSIDRSSQEESLGVA